MEKFPHQITDERKAGHVYTYTLNSVPFRASDGRMCSLYSEHDADGEKVRDVVIYDDEI